MTLPPVRGAGVRRKCARGKPHPSPASASRLPAGLSTENSNAAERPKDPPEMSEWPRGPRAQKIVAAFDFLRHTRTPPRIAGKIPLADEFFITIVAQTLRGSRIWQE